MKNMQVLGMDLTDYPVKEAMRMVDRFLKDARVNTVSFLSMDTLMNAAEDDKLREALSSADLTVPTSAEILSAAGIAGRSRVREVEEGRFYTELLKKLSDEKRTVFILAEKEETISAFMEYLNERARGIKIVGSFAFENLTGDPDVVVNEMNAAFPDVIFSRLSSPRQEEFIDTHNSKLNARMWVALKEDFVADADVRKERLSDLKLWVKKTLFRRKVSKFTVESDKGEDT